MELINGRSLAVWCAVLVLLAGTAFAAVPVTISYQGVLTDGTGTAITNPSQSMVFSLYGSATGGSPVWSETQTVNVQGGTYAVQLGAVSPLSGSLFSSGNLWLEVSVGGEVLAGRQRLNSVPYALVAGDADTVGGYDAASLDQSAHLTDTGNPHNVTAAQIGAADAATLSAHTGDTGNPHGVTAAQTGAVAKSGDTMTGRLTINDTTPGSVLAGSGGGLVVSGTGPAGTDQAGYTPGVSGAIPATGTGTRMMWYPEMAAFRAGQVSGSQWDDANIGAYSFSAGLDNKADGSYATALGMLSEASGKSAFAAGYKAKATGLRSTALGQETQSIGWATLATGFQTVASGTYATAMGNYTEASGQDATAMGAGSKASGETSTAMGYLTIAPSYAETALGAYNTSYTPSGPGGWITSDRLFVIGNGTSEQNRSDALVMLKNGDTTLNGTLSATAFVGDGSALTNLPTSINSAMSITDTTPGPVLTGSGGGLTISGSGPSFNGTGYDPGAVGAIPATGAGVRMMWYPEMAAFRAGEVSGSQWNEASIGPWSVATGFNTTASGPYATAMGLSVTASGSVATALGNGTEASGQYATAMGYGTTARERSSTAFGNNTLAAGVDSTALGRDTIARSLGEVAIGLGNTDYLPLGNTYAWHYADRLFVIGNGINPSNRSDALVVLKNGDTTINGNTTFNGNTSISGTATINDDTTINGNASIKMNASIAGDATVTGNLKAFSFLSEGSIATGTKAVALGDTTSAGGQGAVALGVGSYAAGDGSVALGSHASAFSLGEIAVGRFNTAYSPTGGTDTWNADDRLFVIGNGSSATTPSDALVVLKNGNTGIGTLGPEATLHVAGGNWDLSSTEGDFKIGDTSNRLKIGVATGGGGAGQARIYAEGTNPKLFLGAGGAAILDLDGPSGNATFTGDLTVNGTFSNPSDIRLKDVHGNFERGLEDILKLQPIVYSYKRDNPLHLTSTETLYGFSAQALQKVIPEAVSELQDGYLKVSKDPVLWAMLNAIKQLKQQKDEDISTLRAEKDARIAVLKQQQQQLSAKVAEQAARIAQMEQEKQETLARLTRLEETTRQLAQLVSGGPINVASTK
ncbi:hypothetical protein C2E25_15820 [Geothermobacter hydrogeniphilus]|uniref:Peptidase S74 domain-containing protein n=1 Tax=Geothermobacter hydrogeniphilus TaxID=1969733 RepID=A0A2K2H669_9BACT|nr:tail fiber domain-containing protein [Geothermobacter hydrogeniphilus]PNU18798.1 hypothetical protein C2E25_15820 [Geothermobacter hydrogeniphilus]